MHLSSFKKVKVVACLRSHVLHPPSQPQAALFQKHDPLRQRNHIRAMADQDGGFAPALPQQLVQQFGFAHRVKAAGGFVENQMGFLDLSQI